MAVHEAPLAARVQPRCARMVDVELVVVVLVVVGAVMADISNRCD